MQQHPYYPREDLSEADFVVFTDGGSSGKKTDFGGSAAIIYSEVFDFCHTLVSGETFSGAYRAELNGLLQALHGCIIKMGREETEKSMEAALEDNGGFPFTVTWYGDNKSLCDAVAGKSGGGAEAGLWSVLHWYLKWFDVTPIHVHRATVELQDVTDVLASGFREELKEWYRLSEDGGVFQNVE